MEQGARGIGEKTEVRGQRSEVGGRRADKEAGNNFQRTEDGRQRTAKEEEAKGKNTNDL